MNFTYTASGKMKLLGCVGQIASTINVITAYSIGEILYLKQKALMGKLERITVKRINVINEFSYNYQDMLNRIWIEKELITLTEAQSMIVAFKEKQQKAYLLYLKNCNSSI